ncbi:MAG: hypothetical protein DRJ35_01655 [Thermoprotei archaeon]|nr:MAG: hypothetical protein DRJ35_01655 [Thermoprotei archaeon]
MPLRRIFWALWTERIDPVIYNYIKKIPEMNGFFGQKFLLDVSLVAGVGEFMGFYIFVML